MKEVTPREVVILLELIAFLTPRQQNFFLKTLNKKQMRVMEVAFFNLATNHTGLSKKEEKTLSKYKRPVEILASKQYKLGEKRKVITQKGGFWGAILPILGTVVSSFLASR